MRTKLRGNRANDWPGLNAARFILRVLHAHWRQFAGWASLQLNCFVSAQTIAFVVTYYEYWLHGVLDIANINSAKSNSERPINDHQSSESWTDFSNIPDSKLSAMPTIKHQQLLSHFACDLLFLVRIRTRQVVLFATFSRSEP